MTNSLISIDKLYKEYSIGVEKIPVLKHVSLSIASGELVAIVGASGSGKSTLMNIIGLLDNYSQGHYSLDGKNVSLLDDDARATLRNRYIGFVFQQFNLLPRFTALQNVALPLIYRTMANQEQERRVQTALERVGMLTYAHHHPTQLSGGQQQRVAIARALVTHAEVILADEPTGALDSKTGMDVMNLFHTLHQEGRTIIIVTHDDKIAAQCPRQIKLLDGQIIEDRTT